MKLCDEIIENGNTLIDGSKITQEWILAFLHTTRDIRLKELGKESRRLIRLVVTAILIFTCLGITDVIHIEPRQLPLVVSYWCFALSAFQLVPIIKKAKLKPGKTIPAELVFCKGTIATMPAGSFIVQAVLTEANRNRECDLDMYMTNRHQEGYYAVCRCYSTTVVTPLRNYDSLDIFD